MRSSLALPRRLLWIFTVSILTGGFLGFLLLFAPRNDPVPPLRSQTVQRPVVKLRQGTIIGLDREFDYPQALEEFRGVRYGLSTAGARRFRPPLPVGASTETFDASTYRTRCHSGNSNDGTPEDEDCLNVNIYRPKVRSKTKKLPVLIHVHGGSFNFGAGYSRTISSLVAHSAKPMIGVSFNYRLGAFGFLASNVTAKEGLLNVGLKDQALLFQWVQENIAAFDGDPNDVTIMGNSAGAHSIGHHLMHNTDRAPPFQKVIMESGASTARAVYSYNNKLHEQQFREFLKEVGCQKTSEELITMNLRLLTAEEIKRASAAVFNKYNLSLRWPFQPVIDGDGGMIPIRPIDAWRSGKWHKIPILTGFNTNEGALFVPVSMSTSKQFTNFFRVLLPELSEGDLNLLNEMYADPSTDPESKYKETRKSVGAQFKRIEQAYGHYAYTAPVRHTVHFAAEPVGPHVYLYHFAVNNTVNGGANHGDHAEFATYDRGIVSVSPALEKISGSMHAYWTSFITTGDPNTVKGRFPDRPQWPAYVQGRGELVVFGEGNDERAGGSSPGTAVKLANDTWPAQECGYWWARAEEPIESQVR